MNSRDWRRRDWIYWPASWENAAPSVLGLVLFLVLSAFGLRKIPAWSWVPDTVSGFVLAGIAFATFNAVLLWFRVWPQYLTGRLALRPFIVTYTLLTVTATLIWGLALVLRGQALVAGSGRFDLLFTAQCVAEGLAALTPALLLSSIWRTDRPSPEKVRQDRAKVLLLGRELLAEKPDKEVPRDLRTALPGLLQDARALSILLQPGRDLDLLRSWEQATQRLQDAIEGRSVHDLDDPTKAKLRDALQEIEQNAPSKDSEK